jgi:hypothetical protein
MELSTTRDTTGWVGTRQPLSILWNLKVHYRIYKIYKELPVPILSKTKPVQTTPFCISKIYLNIIHHLTSYLLSGLFPSGFPTNNPYVFHLSTYMLHALPVLSSLTWSFKLYLVKSTIETTKLFVMQFPPPTSQFIAFRAKYSPPHPFPKSLALFLITQCSERLHSFNYFD